MSIGTLHFAYITLGSKCLWLMKELGLDVELRLLDMKNGEHKSPEYMKLNPHGTSPTLVLPNGTPLWESSAIIHHILDNYDAEGKLQGAPGSDVRTTFHLYQGFAGEAEPTLIALFIHLKMLPKEKSNPALIAAKRTHWEEKLASFYNRLITSPDQKYAVGDAFSIVDITVTYPLHLANVTGLLEDHPNLKSYVEGIYQRPLFKPCFEG